MDRDDRPYHHGALRAQLIDAGLELISREGVAAVSLRRLAREAHVSPSAPYHHFADRAALFSAVLTDGNTLLLGDLRAARASTDDPLDAMCLMVLAYVDFAHDHPAHMKVMLRPELIDATPQPALPPADSVPSSALVEASGTAVIDELRSAIADAAAAGVLPADDVEPTLHLVWSMAVGFVTLWLDGPVAARCATLDTTPEVMARRLVETLRRMLASVGR